MAKPLRIYDPDLVYHVSNRCIFDMFMLRPDAQVNAIILACLGRALAKYPVDLMCFVFMSNHFHMLLRSHALNISSFLGEFQSLLATRMRAHLKIDKDRKHPLFAGNFSSFPLLDDAQVYDKMIYLLANPCAADIVEKPEHYPGLSSLNQHYTGESVTGRWLDKVRLAQRSRGKTPCDPEKVTTEYQIPLTRLPGMEDLSQAEVEQRIRKSLDKRVAKLKKARKTDGRRLLGPAAARRVDPFSRPKKSKTSPCPTCMGNDPEQIEQYKEHIERVTTSYKSARKRERSPTHKQRVHYPPGTFPPATRRCTPMRGKAHRDRPYKTDISRCAAGVRS